MHDLLKPLLSLVTICYLADVVIIIVEGYVGGVVHVPVEHHQPVHHPSAQGIHRVELGASMTLDMFTVIITISFVINNMWELYWQAVRRRMMVNITIMTSNISTKERNVAEELIDFGPAVHEEEGGKNRNNSKEFSETDLDTEEDDRNYKKHHQQEQVEYQPVE